MRVDVSGQSVWPVVLSDSRFEIESNEFDSVRLLNRFEFILSEKKSKFYLVSEMFLLLLSKTESKMPRLCVWYKNITQFLRDFCTISHMN